MKKTAASQTRARSTALHPGQSSIEGKRIRCHRCWAAGQFVRRTQSNWPPWYVEWIRPALPPASESLIFMEAQAAPMAHSCCPALDFAGTPLQRSRLTGGEPMTTPPREDDDPRAEDRSRGPGPATRAYVVLDPRKMSTGEMAAAIMAMVAASKKKKG